MSIRPLKEMADARSLHSVCDKGCSRNPVFKSCSISPRAKRSERIEVLSPRHTSGER